MTILAGRILLNGATLIADCRATAIDDSFRQDIVQKVFPLSRGTAIGFCGPIRAAGILLRAAFSELPNKSRSDPVSICNWIARFLRFKFEAAKLSTAECDQVTFMIAGSWNNRPTIIGYDTIIKLRVYPADASSYIM